MKIRHLFPILFLIPTIAINSQNKTYKDIYLKDVLNNLEKIKSASYLIEDETWQEGDKNPLQVRNYFVEEYDNPNDSTIGASFANFASDNREKLMTAYNGHVKLHINDKNKTATTNDFTNNRLPFKPISPPFFSYTKSILKYTLATKDSITVEVKEFEDHYYLKLVINEDNQVEFFGKAYYIDNTHCTDPTSVYEIWIAKSNNLPYKIRREMSHQITVTTCSGIKLNKLSINNFDMFSHLPSNYKMLKRGEKQNSASKKDITGMLAPDWSLNDYNGQAASLSDFKSKVLLINFTGIGCGVCVVSIPFLNGLQKQFDREDLEVVAIEGWMRKPQSLQNYSNKYNLKYKILCATEDIIKEYEVGSAAPIFVILDEQRIVRKVIRGYRTNTTDDEIKASINELLSK